MNRNSQGQLKDVIKQEYVKSASVVIKYPSGPIARIFSNVQFVKLTIVSADNAFFL